MTADPHLITEVANHVATLTINRPEKRNALSPQAIDLLLHALDAAEQDAAVHVVVLTGAGEQAFCAGADLLGALSGGESGFDLYGRLLKRLTHFSKPLVARINGFCLAGGMGLLLACDLAVACDDVEFGAPEVNVGIFPMMISTLILRDMQRKHALEMILLGERMGTQRALEWGLINRAVPRAELDQTVNAITAALAAKSSVGLRMGKESLDAVIGLPYDQAVDVLSDRLKALIATDDAQEGLRAFAEKRPPRFSGR